MYRIAVFLLLLFLINPVTSKVEATGQSDYEKAVLSLMFDQIYKAVNDNYDIQGVQFEDQKILSLNMTNGLTFDVTIQIQTFIGAHNTIGTDTLRFKRELNGVKLVRYSHHPSPHSDELIKLYMNP